jgi:hypothetical protein
MTPLRVLLIHRDNDHYRTLSGWWSSPIPEFTWQTRAVKPDNFTLDLRGAERDFDLVVMDDWIFGEVRNRSLPMAYVIVDSARSQAQFARNVRQAKYADLLLVDSDELRQFKTIPYKPVRRFAHAVRTDLFYPQEKKYDVGFLCWPTPERREVADHLAQFCRAKGYSFITGTWADTGGYAEAIRSACIVVHKAHVEAARSWRVFDVLASGGCLLSSPLPTVSGDGIANGEHYHTYRDLQELEQQAESLLTSGAWMETAKRGYDHVLTHHTWPIRATQLRQMADELTGVPA